MATQGLVTVKKDGAVALKIVAGDDGYNAKKVADAIRAKGTVPTLEEAYQLAKQKTFGSESCLVVVGPDRAVSDDFDFERYPLYRDTFNQPEFNPRWEQGIADYVEIVEL